MRILLPSPPPPLLIQVLLLQLLLLLHYKPASILIDAATITSSRPARFLNSRPLVPVRSVPGISRLRGKRLPPVHVMNGGKSPVGSFDGDDDDVDVDHEFNANFDNNAAEDVAPPCHLVINQLEEYALINGRSFDTSLLQNPRILDCIPMDAAGDLLGLVRQLFAVDSKHEMGGIYRFIERAAEANKFLLIRIILHESPAVSSRLNVQFLRPALLQAIRHENFITARDLVEFGVPFGEFCDLAKSDISLAVKLYQHFIVSYREANECYRRHLQYDKAVGNDKRILGMELRNNANNKPLNVDAQKIALRDFIHHSTLQCLVEFAAANGDVRLLRWLLSRPRRSPQAAQASMNGLKMFFSPHRPNQFVNSLMGNVVYMMGLPTESLRSIKALHLAVEHKHNDCLRLLLEEMQKERRRPTLSYANIQELLDTAVRSANEPAVLELRKYFENGGKGPRKVSDSALILFRDALHREDPERYVSELLNLDVPLPDGYYTEIAKHVADPRNMMRVVETLHFHAELPSLQDGFGAMKELASRGLPFLSVLKYIHANLAIGEAERLQPADYEAIVEAALDADHSDLLAFIVPQFEHLGLVITRVLERRARLNQMAGMQFLIKYCGISDVSKFRILRDLTPAAQLNFLRELMESTSKMSAEDVGGPVGCFNEDAKYLERCLQLTNDEDDSQEQQQQ